MPPAVDHHGLGDRVGPGGAPGLREDRDVADGHDAIVGAVDEQHRPVDGADRRRRAHRVHRVPAWLEVDAGGQPRERPGDRRRDRQPGEAERLAGQPVGVGRRGDRDHGVDRAVLGGRHQGSGRTHRVPEEPDARDLRAPPQLRDGGPSVRRVLADGHRELLRAVGAVAAHVERQHVEAGGVQDLRVRDRSIAGRFPAVDEDDARPCGGPRRDEPAGEAQAAR